jgi:Arc/MetJ-type ribon-helix-helix transcriptional regulator
MLKYYMVLLGSIMENVSLKIETEFEREIEKAMKKNGYSTKTEFIREALRDKIQELEKQEALKKLEKLFGSSKHKTTDEQLHAAGEKAFEQLEKKFK